MPNKRSPTGQPWKTILSVARTRVLEAEMSLDAYKTELKRLRKQAKCPHRRLDRGGIYGHNCLDCDLYMNDGI